MARVMYLKNALPVTTVRFFNTVGPRQTGKYGMVIPRFVQAALKGVPIQVHGDGTQTRVFCHVKDAVRAIDLIVKDDSTIGEVYNVGGTEEISILNLALKILEYTDSSSEIIKIPYSKAYSEGYEDMQRRVPNTAKIEKALGWKSIESLESIIKDVTNYFLKI